MATRKERILHLIEQRQHQLHYEHEREYLATLLDNMAQKEVNKISSNGMLPAVLSDADYIKELEGLICFLAGRYEKTKETYFDTHLHTCSVANPDRRDLTDAEQSEWQRFPMIQGTRLQNIISAIAKANKPTPIDAQGLLERFTA